MLESILILCELYFPSIFYKTSNISPAFFLLLIIFIKFKYGRISAIFTAFLFGFMIDVLIQHSWFGFITLLTCVFAYFVGYLIKINNLKIKYIISILLFLLYFYFYYLIQFSGSFIDYLELSFMKSLSTIIAYCIINFIFNKRYNFFEKQF